MVAVTDRLGRRSLHKKELEDADFGDYGDQLRDIYADASALPFVAVDVQAEIGAIEDAEALADVAQADAFYIDVGHFLFRDANAIVFNFHVEAAISIESA